MKQPRYTLLRGVLLMLILSACPLGAALADTARISELTAADRQFMDDQRVLIDDLASTEFGLHFHRGKSADLDLLQRLLDRGTVKPEQTRVLQAMGVIMGDLLADDLGLHWVIYQDREGRSRALRYKDSDDYLFPMTMISRRREAGNTTPVRQIYDKARAIMTAQIPALPFQ